MPRELAAAIDESTRRGSEQRDQSVTSIDSVLCSKTLADDDAERVARVHIDDERCAEPFAINELVGDEIHRRRLIWTLRDMALASSNDYFPVRGRWPRA